MAGRAHQQDPATAEGQLSRRDFLRNGVLTLFAAALPGSGCAARRGSARRARALMLAPERDVGAEAFSLGLLDLEARSRTAIPVEFRGHVALGRPDDRSRVVVLAHRPGTLSCEVDLAERRVTRTFRSAPGHHFYGHGVFSADASLLYTTENDYETGSGVIAVRDAASFELLGELPSHGVGPHEMRTVSEGIFVVANGGVRTDPRHDERLRVDEIRSSLCFLQAASGKLLEVDALSHRYLSIRHIEPTPGGGVVVGLRHYHEEPAPSVLALRPPDGTLRLLIPPDGLASRMHPEALSLAVHAPSRTLAATHPRGNLVTFWGLDDGAFFASLDLEHPQGVAALDGDASFLVTTSRGRLYRVPLRSPADAVALPTALDGLNGTHVRSWVPS